MNSKFQNHRLQEYTEYKSCLVRSGIMKFLFYKSNHRIQEYTEYKSCLVSVIWGGLLGCWGRSSTNRGSVVCNRPNRSPRGAVQQPVQRPIWGAVQRPTWDRSGFRA